jgi:hypothetical protein
MPPRKDQAIYDYVATHEDQHDRWVERVAAAVGLPVHDVRVRVHQSKRLWMRTTGVVGWHIVELTHAEPNQTP